MDVIDARVQCPHCFEEIDLELDPSLAEQTYPEDCSVCCRPITIHCRIDPESGAVERVEAFAENG